MGTTTSRSRAPAKPWNKRDFFRIAETRRATRLAGRAYEPGAIWAWTDYPLLQEECGRAGPIRRVRVLRYDRDKYALIRWGRALFTIKAGYLYQRAGRCTEVPPIDVEQLPTGDIFA